MVLKSFDKNLVKYFNFILLMLVLILTLFNVNINNVEAAIVNVGDTEDFDYTGTVQEFTAPYNGYYKLETWGAEGGVPTGANANFGFYDGTRWKYYSLSHAPGSYVTGKIFLNKKQKIYIVVGGKGTYVLNSKSLFIKGGYNGGGDKIYDFPTDGYVSSIQNSGSGGGATHIAFYPGVLSELENHKNDNGIIMVAGGGSGASYFEGVKNDGTTELAGFYGSSGQGLYITTPWTSCTSNGNLCGNDYIFDNNLKVYQATNNRGGFYIDASDHEYNSMYNNGEIVYSIPTNAINKSFFGQGGSYFTGGGGGYYGGTGGIYKYNVGGLSYVNNDLLDEKHVVCETCDVENNKNEQEITTSLGFHDRGKDIATENKPKNLDGYARVTLLEKTKDNNTKLSTLNASNGQYGFFTSSFDPSTTVYSVNVPNSVTALNVTATPEETTTTVAGTGVKQLTEGNNEIVITTTAEDGTIGTYTLNVYRQSDDAYLSDIKINLNSIENFDPETFTYNLEVEPYMSQINLTPVKGQTGQVLSYKSNPNLKYGENVIKILVTSETGAINTYTLNITRNRPVLVENISVEGFTIEPIFNPSTTTYDVDVYNTTEKVNIIVTTNEDAESVVGDGEVTLTENDTTHEIIVTDYDGDSYTYTVNIHKAFDGNNKIKRIQFGKNKIEYRVNINENETNYSVNVPFDYTDFNVLNINTDNEEQTFKFYLNNTLIETNSFNLEEINNVLKIEVYDAFEKLMNTYTLNIIRTKSDVTTLDSITVNKGYLKETFDKDKTNYTWVIPKEVTTLTNEDVTVTLTDENATVTIPEIVTYNEDGDLFNIVVLAYNQTDTKTYSLSLEHDSSSDARLKTLSVNGFTLSPEFDKDINTYNLNIYDNTEKITFIGETLDEDATILSELENVVTNKNKSHNIIVQAEDGTINTYVINISKSIKSDTSVSKIEIGNNSDVDYTVKIINNTNNYDLTVPYQYNYFNYINVVSTNEELTYKYYINDTLITDTASLNEGANLFKVEVYDGLGELRNTYNITINRVKSNDASLKELTPRFGDLSPNFKSNVTSYTWTVPKNTENIYNVNLEVEANDSNATVRVPALTNVEDGSLEIEVVAEDGVTTKTYTLNLVKISSNEARLKNISVEYGEFRTRFNKDTYTYDIDTYTTSESVEISAEAIDTDATITGSGTVNLTSDDTTHVITVLSEDESVTKTYTLNIHKTLDKATYTVSSVKIGNDEVTSYTVLFTNGETKKVQTVASDFKTFNYIEAVSTNTNLNYRYYINDEEITTNANVLEGSNIVKIDAYNNQDKVNTYYVTLTRTRTESISSGGSGSIEVGTSQTYTECTTENTYVVPETGMYQFEVWGGGSEFVEPTTADYLNNPRLYKLVGAYATGAIKLNKDEVLYPVPGGNGQIATDNYKTGGLGGCNGGGAGSSGANYYSGTTYYMYAGNGGGGASHIALRSGMLSELENYKDDVLIVASGSGGFSGLRIPAYSTNNAPQKGYVESGTNYSQFHPGGGYYGVVGSAYALTATQTSGYAFGQGADGYQRDKVDIPAGGSGSGWYGGSQYGSGYTNQSTSGSSYIGNSRLISYKDVTKIMRVKTTLENKNDDFFSQLYPSSNSPSNEVRTENGLTKFSYENLDLYEENEYGPYKFPDSGLIKITYMGKEASLNLKSLIVQGYSLNPEFDPETKSYSLTVDTSTIDIAAELEDEANVVTGIGTINVSSGTNAHNIIVTSPDGDTETYVLNITKSTSNNANLSNIIINGEQINGFDPETYTYNLNVDSNTNNLDILAVKGHDGQTLNYDTNVLVNSGNNSYTIVVTAENNTTTKTYTINVYKESLIGLSDLNVDDFELSPEFDPETSTYTLHVYKNTESINVNATLLDSSVANLYGTGNISITSNNMNHKVGAVDKNDSTNKTEYTINILRDITYNDELKNISIENDSVACKNNMCTLNPTFSGTRIGYTFDVPYAYDSFTLDIEKNNNEQSYKTILNGVETNSYSLNEGENTLKVELYDGLNKLVRTYTIVINRTKSGDATLKSLTSNKGILTPTFDKDTTSYELKVYDNEDSVTFSGETNDENATVLSGLGKVTLSNDTTNHEIEVEAEDGTKLTYNVTIKKSISTNYNITDIKVIDNKDNELTKSPAFNSSIKEYSVNIPFRNSIDDIEIISNNKKLTKKVKLNGNYVDNYNLDNTNNVFIIEIYDELNKKVDEYEITVNRSKSNEATLDELTVNVGKIKETFESDKYNYTWIIPKNVSEVTNNNISYKLTDSLSTINIPNSVNYSENTTFDIVVTAEDGETTNTYSLLLEYEKNTESRLKTLEVNDFILNPEFDKDTYNYVVNVYDTTDKINIVAETLDEDATIVTGIGEITLTEDEQVNNIIVNAEDGSISTYILTINKVGSSDRTIENIRIYNNSITCGENECVYDKEFNQGITDYTMTVPYEFKNFDLDVVTNNNQITSKVLINGIESSTYNLTVGNNQVQVKVYDSIGDLINTYIFNITRKESDNNYLSRLSISGYNLSPAFNKETNEYTIELDNNTSSIPYSNFSVKTEDSRATYSINGYNNLSNVRNDIWILVTAPNGEQRYYTIHAYKGTPTDLESLTVNKISGEELEYRPVFNKDIKNYTLNVPYEVASVNINAVAEYDDEVTISGTGVHDLEVGTNEINIVVLNSTGFITTYMMTINRDIDKNVDLISLDVEEALDKIDFYSNITTYNIDVESTAKVLTINAVPSNPNAIVEITGNKIYPTKNFYSENDNWGINSNKVQIRVWNGNKTYYKDYVLNVTRSANDNINLSYLDIKDQNGNTIDYSCPRFDSDFDECKIIISDDVTSYKIYAKAESDLSIAYYPKIGVYEEWYRFNNGSLDTNTTDFDILVKAESGRKKRYKFRGVKTSEFNSTLTDLSYISINSKIYRFIYNQDTDEYEAIYNDEYKAEYVNEQEMLIAPAVNAYDARSIVLFDEDGNSYQLKKIYASGNYLVGNVSKYIKMGDNKFTFEYGYPGNEKEYVFNLIRDYDNSTYIKNLTTSGVLDKSFNKTEQEYNVDVRKNVRSLDLGIELESKTSTYEIIGNENFKESKTNEVIIRVTAKNGDTRDYKLNVNLRDDDYFVEGAENIIVKDSNNDELTLSPTFDMDTNHYNVTVPYGTEYVNLEVIKANSLQVIRIDGTDEEDGKRRIDIDSEINNVVVNILKGNNNKEYTITINRLKNNDASLSSLSIKNNDEIVNISPDFNSKTTSYTASVDSTVSELNVLATTTDPNASYYVLGSNYLTGGSNTVKVVVTAADGTTTKEYNITVEKDMSTNNYLSSLSVENHEISPAFDKTTKKYSLTVNKEISNINILAQAEDSRSTVTGIGNKELNVGLNTFNISVTSESGEINTYELEVTRKEGTNSLLESLFISEGTLSPTFDSETLDYTLTVSDSVNEVNIVGTPMDNGATVSGNRYYDVSETATIKVTSEDSSSETEYNITIVKEGFKSAFLKKLKVNNGIMTPDFKKTTLIYSIEVQNEINELNLEYEKEDSEAITSISGNSNLVVGQNKVEITVTSSDGFSTNTYELYVTKKEEATNYLKSLEVEGYEINPEFNKDNLYYDLTVPNYVDKVTITAEAEDELASITGIGEVDLSYGENIFDVKVTKDSITRTYQISITRSNLDENYLLSLESDIGEFDREFDKEINEYTLTLPAKTKKINLSGEISPTATVNGLGEVNITNYESIRNIYVTSQSGNINIYKINIVKEKSSNTNLLYLVPSLGEIEYSNDIDEYNIEIDDRDKNIVFIAVPEDEDAKVQGTDKRSLDYGLNEIIIKVIAEDEVTEREIKLNITMKASLEDFSFETDEIVIVKGEEEQINIIKTPIDSNVEFNYESLDPLIAFATVDGKVQGILEGETRIKVTPEGYDTEKYVTVKVISDEIKSDKYEVSKEEDKDKIIIGLEPGTTIEEFKENLSNPKEYINVYDKDGNLLTDEDIVKTGLIVKLEYNEKVYDEAIMVVRGDVDGDGVVNVTDYMTVLNHALELEEIDDYIKFKASDVEIDNMINVTDYIKIMDYALENLDTLN